jgi:hypothetical protein
VPKLIPIAECEFITSQFVNDYQPLLTVFEKTIGLDTVYTVTMIPNALRPTFMIPQNLAFVYPLQTQILHLKLLSTSTLLSFDSLEIASLRSPELVAGAHNDREGTRCHCEEHTRRSNLEFSIVKIMRRNYVLKSGFILAIVSAVWAAVLLSGW